MPTKLLSLFRTDAVLRQGEPWKEWAWEQGIKATDIPYGLTSRRFQKLIKAEGPSVAINVQQSASPKSELLPSFTFYDPISFTIKGHWEGQEWGGGPHIKFSRRELETSSYAWISRHYLNNENKLHIHLQRIYSGRRFEACSPLLGPANGREGLVNNSEACGCSHREWMNLTSMVPTLPGKNFPKVK